jgi:SAM-dependent methyltransferase
MAIHHAAEKLKLFRQVFTVLKPDGVFVFADHMAGKSELPQTLIDRERAFVRLGRDTIENREQVLDAIRLDEEMQRVEGNVCESVSQYLNYLAVSGFEGADCLWRDYWSAVFVARKPTNGRSSTILDTKCSVKTLGLQTQPFDGGIR